MSDSDSSYAEDNQQADMSAESVLHDDFEYSTIFDNMPKEVRISNRNMLKNH